MLGGREGMEVKCVCVLFPSPSLQERGHTHTTHPPLSITLPHIHIHIHHPKTQGNARFKAGDFSGAVERFTDSLAYDSSSKEHAAVAYANRALARLKMGR